ncbi:MAG: heme exporter protein CcmB, partial [Brucella anthropi]
MLALFLRDLRLSFRAGGGALIGILFFLAVISVMPFGVGPDLNLLARIGPAMLWVGALLATLLGLDRLFQADREDGSLDLLLIGADSHMLAFTVFVKCVAHWVASVLP